MILLRLLCMMAGVLVLIAPSMLLPTGGMPVSLPAALGMLVMLLLASSSFFFIGLAGNRFKASPKLHRLCLLLLAAPLVVGAATLWRAADPAALWMSGTLLGFTMFVCLILTSPLLQRPSARRLRAREART